MVVFIFWDLFKFFLLLNFTFWTRIHLEPIADGECGLRTCILKLSITGMCGTEAARISCIKFLKIGVDWLMSLSRYAKQTYIFFLYTKPGTKKKNVFFQNIVPQIKFRFDAELWIRNDLFRFRLQLLRVPDPNPTHVI